MKKELLCSLLLGAMLFLPLLSFASERLVIDFGDAEYSGRNTFNLREAVRRDYRDTDNLLLNSVEVEVLPESERSWVLLEVGHAKSDKYHFNQAGYDRWGYSDRHERMRDIQVVRINNPAYTSDGDWLLHLHGDLVVRNVSLNVSRAERRGYRDSRHRGNDLEFGGMENNEEVFSIQKCIGGSKCGGRHAEVRVSLGRPRYVSEILINANDDVGSKAKASINVYADGRLIASHMDIRKDGKTHRIDVRDSIGSVVIKPASDDEAVIDWIKIER